MFCPKCGSEVEAGKNFCGKCGSPINGNQSGIAPNTPQINNQQGFVPQPFMNMPQTIQKQKNIPAAVSGAVFALGSFLPFISASVLGFSQSITLMKGGDGIISLILGGLAILFALLGKNVAVTVVGAFSAIFSLFEIGNVGNAVSSEYGAIVKKEIGYWCIVLGGLAILACGIYGIISNKKKQVNQ